MFYRRPEQVALTFSMPAVICILLGSIFSATLPNSDTSTGAVIAASMLAYGVLSTSFINLGISIAADRDTGALRRLRGTPATATSYFVGKIALVAIVSFAEAVILLWSGCSSSDLHLPRRRRMVVHAGVGLRPRHRRCSLLGIFISNFASNAVSAAVITNGPAVGLQFVSGTYVPLMVLPAWMLTIGSIFPIKWMAQGFRSVLLPPEMVVFEPAGSRGARADLPGPRRVEHRRAAACCLTVFRWSDETLMPPLIDHLALLPADRRHIPIVCCRDCSSGWLRFGQS